MPRAHFDRSNDIPDLLPALLPDDLLLPEARIVVMLDHHVMVLVVIVVE